MTGFENDVKRAFLHDVRELTYRCLFNENRCASITEVSTLIL